jgi:hypothetical protein
MYRMSRNLGASAYWNPLGLSRPLIRLLYPLSVYVFQESGCCRSHYSTHGRGLNFHILKTVFKKWGPCFQGTTVSQSDDTFFSVLYLARFWVGCNSEETKFSHAEYWSTITSETPLATNFTKLCKNPIHEFRLDVTGCRLMLHSTGYKLQVTDFNLNIKDWSSLTVQRTYPSVHVYCLMKANWYEQNIIGFIYIIYCILG